ncbi:hypothetical protein [Enterococcus larvae]|uniref:hypothetical protein n=1 Tax=Enterococcus larvae TaxID=2794352 RepID=UPI003F3E9696
MRKKRTAADYYYYGETIKPTVTDVKSMRFMLYLQLFFSVVSPIYIFKQLDEEILPYAGLFGIVLLSLVVFFVLDLIILCLFKTKIYEASVYFGAGLFFMCLSGLMIVFGYSYFFDRHVSMEVFHTLNETDIEQKKIVLLNRLLLLPIVFFIIGSVYQWQIIARGEAREHSRTTEKYKKSSKYATQLFSIYFPIIVSLLFFLRIIESFDLAKSIIPILPILFIASGGVLAWTAPIFFIISRIKFKYPNIYLEKNILDNRGRSE